MKEQNDKEFIISICMLSISVLLVINICYQILKNILF